MLRGYFSSVGGVHRPFISATLRFPTLDDRRIEVELLVDTGADRSLLAPRDAARLRIDLTALPPGRPSTGIGGRSDTYSVEAVMSFQTVAFRLPLIILPAAGASLSIPSLLGRDILSQFALIVEQRTDRVLLLEPAEADALSLPTDAQ